MIVLTRYATMTTAASRVAGLRATRSRASVAASSTEKQSSNRYRRGRFTSARAIDSRWRRPPETFVLGQPVHPGGTLATVAPGSHGLPSWSVRNVPWWGVLPSALGPALLVGACTTATLLQPPSFEPVADTVSALAAVGATDRWVMTLTFVVVAVREIVAAAALRPAGRAGWLILVAGAVAGMLVALNPEHRGGGSVPHAIWA
jgi:Protein of unknown function (DUF998)